MERGSYTIEAAFIVPVVAGIAFLILYTLFLQHDRVILQANLDNGIFLLAEGKYKDKQDYGKDLQKHLWCMEVQEAELSDGIVLLQGKVAAEAFWEIPLLSYFIAGKESVVLSESYGCLQPEELLRLKTRSGKRGGEK
ncbi:hypothetical protein D7V86_03065 [bacterium D16-51]|nr:hypothetical protein D7V96_02585 [bacterium D16-59]RKI62107.1 hypothetical protein D7V86_03065 [bacterium D16-51]